MAERWQTYHRFWGN